MALSLKDSVVMNITGNASGNVPKRTQLYNNATGTNGTVTLSQTAANFNHLRVYFRTNDNFYSSVDVYSPNGKSVCMVGCWVSSSGGNVKMAVNAISGTSMTRTYSNVIAWSASTNANNIYVIRVEGWNE